MSRNCRPLEVPKLSDRGNSTGVRDDALPHRIIRQRIASEQKLRTHRLVRRERARPLNDQTV